MGRIFFSNGLQIDYSSLIEQNILYIVFSNLIILNDAE